MSRGRRAALLAYVAGALLIFAGAGGSATLWLFLAALLARLVPALAPEMALLAFALAILAAGGGVTVLLGGRAYERGHRRTGRFLVDVGAGVGIVWLLFALAEVAHEGGSPVEALFDFAGTLQGAGVLAALAAQWNMKK